MTVNWVDQAALVFSELKDFQRRTVERVYERLYDPDGSGRYLVADEVGLGKTLIARGIVAKAIPRLLAEGKRVDIVYLCSNSELARENIRKLQIGDTEHTALDSRLTMLPLHLHQLSQNASRVNFVAFTPSTSLELRDGLGHASERVLLYWMSKKALGLSDQIAIKRIFAGRAEFKRFVQLVEDFRINSAAKVHNLAIERFEHVLASSGADLAQRIAELADGFPAKLKDLTEGQRESRNQIVGELRALLAKACIELLEPDIIVLDEFQRFSHLLEGEESTELSRQLLGYEDAKLLLLSATPYKMYTSAFEAAGESHYDDFLRTIHFLEGDRQHDCTLEDDLDKYQKALRDATLDASTEQLRYAASQLATRLSRVMVRNERLASTPDRNGMLSTKELVCSLEASDLMSYVGLQNAVDHIDGGGTMEYWRSSPFPLNFLDEQYKLKTTLKESIEVGKSRMSLAKVLSRHRDTLLNWNSFSRYQLSDLGNPRLRMLANELFDAQQAHLMLWVPPSMPHYALRGPFWDHAQAQPRSFTKRLIFSAWRVAPRAIAAMLSHEAERRIHGTSKMLKEPGVRGALNFTKDKGRYGGMPVLALLYPSLVLAKALDPLKFGRELALELNCAIGKVPVERILGRIQDELETVTFRHLPDAPKDGLPDERWYWAAPLFLDQKLEPHATTEWFAQPSLALNWTVRPGGVDAPVTEDNEEDFSKSIWAEHVEEARRWATALSSATPQAVMGKPLGRRPDDLAEILAELAIASPAVCAYRSLLKVVGAQSGHGSTAPKSLHLRTAAARTAWALRGLFNQPDVAGILRNLDANDEAPAVDVKRPYWRQVLQYCVDGGLQAVLDEYLHVLSTRVGPAGAALEERIVDTADEFVAAIELRTAQVGIDVLSLDDSGRTLRRESDTLRAHFALRYGDERSEDGKVVTRASSVRKAFNSPFWPFVLATTSVGQEGLDFHPYCHAVVHWNLPTNPVDLEQREGRVHRFKGHAIRKNVAAAYGQQALMDDNLPGAWVDDWTHIFQCAVEDRSDTSDIIPYWIFANGPAKIERHVFELPLGRESLQFHELRNALTMYRMVFGQARQDDLLAYLTSTFDADALATLQAAARVDLGV